MPTSTLIVAVWLPGAGGVQELSCRAKYSWTEAEKASSCKLFRNPEAYVFQKTSACGAPNTNLGSAGKRSLSTSPRKLGHCSKPKLRSGTDGRSLSCRRAAQATRQPSWCQATESGWHEGAANPLLKILAVGPKAVEEQRGRQVATQIDPRGRKEKPEHQLTNQEITIRIIKTSKEKIEQEGQGAINTRRLHMPRPQLWRSELGDWCGRGLPFSTRKATCGSANAIYRQGQRRQGGLMCTLWKQDLL